MVLLVIAGDVSLEDRGEGGGIGVLWCPTTTSTTTTTTTTKTSTSIKNSLESSDGFDPIVLQEELLQRGQACKGRKL